MRQETLDGVAQRKPKRLKRKAKTHYPTDAEDVSMKDWVRVSGFDFTATGFDLFRYKEHLKATRYENENYKTAYVSASDEGGINSLVTWNHFAHKHDMRVVRHAHTKQIIFIIKDNEQKSGYLSNFTAAYLQKEIGTPEYIEHSSILGEYRLYYTFNEWACRSDLEKWIGQARQQGYYFSVVLPGDKFQLPMSHRFETCGRLSKIDFMKIHIDPIDSIHELKTIFQESYYNTKRPLPEYIRSEYQSRGKTLKKDHVIGGENRKGFKRRIYNFGRGTRHEAFKLIALQSQRLGHSYQQFCNELDLMHDGTSRDMKKGCESQKRGAYEWAIRMTDYSFHERAKGGMETPKEYVVYDEFRLSPRQNFILQESLMRLAREYEQELKVPAQKLIDNTILYYQELIQKREYDIDRERAYDGSLPEHMRNELNKGFIFTKKMRRQMAKKLGIQYIEECHRFLTLTHILKPIIINNNGYFCTYSFKGEYKFAKHYTLMNPANIYLQTKHNVQIIFPEATKYEDIVRDFKEEEVSMYWEYKKTLCNLFDDTQNTNLDVLEKIALSIYTPYLGTYYYVYSINNPDMANINYVATAISSLTPNTLIGGRGRPIRPPVIHKDRKINTVFGVDLIALGV